MFVFLYYCLIVAYIAGGTPLFSEIILRSSEVSWISYLAFSSLFLAVVFFGIKWIDRVNIILTACMFCLFFLVILIGVKSINITNLSQYNFSKMVLSVPVLFGAFGYHNVIPSLCDYLERDRKTLSLSLVLGSLISFIIYLVWQQTVLGSVSSDALQRAMHQGKTCIAALQEITNNSNLYLFGKFFAVTALATSLLGVSLSVVDFLQDGFSSCNIKIKRLWLCLLVFAPCTFFAILNPTIFSKALGIAGGIGESVLNGIFPIIIVWIGFYYMQNPFPVQRYYLAKKYLFFLLTLACLAVGVEVYDLVYLNFSK